MLVEDTSKLEFGTNPAELASLRNRCQPRHSNNDIMNEIGQEHRTLRVIDLKMLYNLLQEDQIEREESSSTSEIPSKSNEIEDIL